MVLDKKTKKILSKVFRQRPKREVTSLMDDERVGYCPEDYESVRLYGFLPEAFNSFTDDEVRAWLDDEMRVTINSPYDCTGKWFTCWITFHRNPNGRISYIHRMSLDV